jgi:hypothetical protein
VPEEEAPDVAAQSFACDFPGCDVAKATKTALGLHRWNAHKIRGSSSSPSRGKAKRPTRVRPDAVIKKEAAPKPPPERAKPRKDGTEVCGWLWAGLAEFVMPGVSKPAAVAMSWQADMAGPILDDAVKGTFLDKLVVQRVAGKGEDVRKIGSLLALPLALVAIENRPLLVEHSQFRKAFRRLVMSNYEALADARIKERRKEERWKAKAEEAGIPLYVTDEGGNVVYEDGHPMDAVDGMVNDLLALVAASDEA